MWLCLHSIQAPFPDRGSFSVWPFLLSQFLFKLSKLPDGDLLFLIENLRHTLDLFNLSSLVSKFAIPSIT